MKEAGDDFYIKAKIILTACAKDLEEKDLIVPKISKEYLLKLLVWISEALRETEKAAYKQGLDRAAEISEAFPLPTENECQEFWMQHCAVIARAKKEIAGLIRKEASRE